MLGKTQELIEGLKTFRRMYSRFNRQELAQKHRQARNQGRGPYMWRMNIRSYA